MLLFLCLLLTEPAAIENGLAAKAPLRLELTEALRISPDDVEGVDASWAGSNQIVQVDARGHMFVMDQRGSRLLEWDKTGKFVRAIGGPGQGPGEYTNLVNFQIFPDQSALALENIGGVTRVTHFEPDFVYKERVSLGGGLSQIPRQGVFSPDRSLMAALTTSIDQARAVEITEFLILDTKPQLKQREQLLYWETMSLDPSKITDPNHWAKFLGERFGSLSKGKNTFAEFDASGRLYTANADSYEITRWSKDLKKELVFRKKYKPIPLTQAEVDALTLPIREAILTQLPPNLQALITVSLVRRAAELAQFPSVKYPVAGLTRIEDQDMMLVIHANSPLTRESRGDLFDHKGVYRGSITHPNSGLSGMIFRDGFAYTIETNADDEATLVRYRYQVKTTG